MRLQDVKLEKRGLVRLATTGVYAVIANRVLHERGRARRFAVAHLTAEWVESGYDTHGQAVARAQQLHQQ